MTQLINVYIVSVCNQPPRLTQPPALNGKGNAYQPMVVAELFGWEENRRSDVILVMHQTLGLDGLRREMSSLPTSLCDA